MERWWFQQWDDFGCDQSSARAWWCGLGDKVCLENHGTVRVYECWEILRIGVSSLSYQVSGFLSFCLWPPYSLVFDCTFSFPCAFPHPSVSLLAELESTWAAGHPHPKHSQHTCSALPSAWGSAATSFLDPQPVRVLSLTSLSFLWCWEHLFACSERERASYS